MIDGVAKTVRQIMIQPQLEPNLLEQLHNNEMCIEKNKTASTHSLHWLNMNADIEKDVKVAQCVWNFNKHNQK